MHPKIASGTAAQMQCACGSAAPLTLRGAPTGVAKRGEAEAWGARPARAVDIGASPRGARPRRGSGRAALPRCCRDVDAGRSGGTGRRSRSRLRRPGIHQTLGGFAPHRA